MRRRQFTLNEADEQALRVAYLNCRDGTTRTRYQAVRLYGTGYAVADILRICECSRRSLLEWCQRYQADGIAALVDHRLGGNRARLRPLEIEELSRLLHSYTPVQLLGADACSGNGTYWTVDDVRQVVANRFGVHYKSITSYRTLLTRCGFSYQRATQQYKSHNEFKVMDFEEQFEKNSLTSPRNVLRP
jgi:transposase